MPAKVNLFLGCGRLRPDGFHDLLTVFHAVSLYDDVTVAPADRLRVEVSGDSADEVPGGEDNLAARAVRALAEHTGHDANVRITIRKGIPVAGGMAGGSADAAAALVACDVLWQTGLARGELDVLAASLGSDVPFSLHGATALGRGRGERLTSVLVRGEYHWVFALADGGLSTPQVYRRLDELRERAVVPAVESSPDRVLGALLTGDPHALGAALTNDLEAAALSLRPELARTLDAGRAAGALGAIVSGSGPTCAFLATDEQAALAIAGALAALGVCRAVRRAYGPVPGARVEAVAGSD